MGNKEIGSIGQVQIEMEAVPDQIGFVILKPDGSRRDIAEAILGKIKDAGLKFSPRKGVWTRNDCYYMGI
jgi:hypothetical protein